MAKRQLSATNMGGIETLNFRHQNLATPPVTDIGRGSVYYDTTTEKLMWRAASTWVDPLARSNHTGTSLATSISDFTAAVLAAAPALRLDQFVAPNVPLSVGNQRIANVGAPIGSNDAVRLTDLQAMQNGAIWKSPVRVRATGNVNVSAPGATHDGVTLAVSDRMLLPAQSAGAENGLWVYQGPAVPLTRATDGATGTLLTGSIVPVLEGTMHGDTAWRLNAPDTAITVGTTATTWGQFANAFSPVEGAGITITGSTIAAKVVSVFGRLGAVVASVGDYVASQVNNDSGVAGATVAAALNTLQTAVTNAVSSLANYVPITRTVTAGAGLTGGGDLTANRTFALDTAVVVRKYAETLAASQTTYTITHNLGTVDVQVRVYQISNGETVLIDDLSPTINTVTIGFAVAPTAGTYRVVVQG